MATPVKRSTLHTWFPSPADLRWLILKVGFDVDDTAIFSAAPQEIDFGMACLRMQSVKFYVLHTLISVISSCTRSFQQVWHVTLVMLTLRVQPILSFRMQSLMSYCLMWIAQPWHADLQVATTVGALAEVGLFHSDISHANILQTGDLIDFQTLWHAQVCAGFPSHSFKRLAQLLAGWIVCPAF